MLASKEHQGLHCSFYTTFIVHSILVLCWSFPLLANRCVFRYLIHSRLLFSFRIIFALHLGSTWSHLLSEVLNIDSSDQLHLFLERHHIIWICFTAAFRYVRAVFKGGYGFKPPRNVEKKIFWQCKKARPGKCECWCTLCLHYCDARKSHLASIKCKKPLWWPGLRPGPRWGSLHAALP